MRTALGIHSIREFFQGLDGGCFTQRAGHNAAFVQESNQPVFGSPRSGSTFYGQPIVPLALVQSRRLRSIVVQCYEDKL
jgi:hypothetical protein